MAFPLASFQKTIQGKDEQYKGIVNEVLIVTCFILSQLTFEIHLRLADIFHTTP